MIFNKYIGIPYKNLGKDFNHADCFGLIYLAIKEEKGEELPDFTRLGYSSGLVNEKEEKLIVDKMDELNNILFELVYPPYKKFDIALFYGAGNRIVNHIGMFINDFEFIHTKENSSSFKSKFDKQYKKRLYKVLRLKGDS